MDAIELLTSQHHTLEALVKTVLAWPDEAVCRQRMQRLADALMLHMVAEESVLYAELWPQPSPGTEAADEALRAAQEHVAMKQRIAALLAMPPLSPPFERALMALQALLQAHHVEEETRLFPLARQRLGAQRRSELGLRLEQLQVQLLRQGQAFSAEPAGLPTPPAARPLPQAASMAAR